MHVSTNDTFDFAVLTLLWDQGTESWGLITRFGMTQSLVWFFRSSLVFVVSLASLTSTSIFITFGNSSIFHTESLEFLAICNLISRRQFGHNDWSYRLPYWFDVTPSDAKPREWTHIWSYTNLRLEGRSLQHGDTLRSWSIHALIICWGRPNRSCNNLIVAS